MPALGSSILALALLIPATIDACAKTGLQGTEPVCSQWSSGLEVILVTNADRPPSSPVVRATWSFNVACPPPQQENRYSFAVRQGADGLLERLPDAGTAPPLTLVPQAEPFRFWINGQTKGAWCVTGTVELADGTTLTAGPYRVDQRLNQPPTLIGFLVGRPDRGGENMLSYSGLRIPGSCPP